MAITDRLNAEIAERKALAVKVAALESRVTESERMVARLAPLLTFLPPSGLDTTPPVVTSQQIINITNNNFNQLIKGNYVEDKALRQTVVTRIFDPQDPNTFVDVRQITALTFVNSLTGQRITWGQ